jgi:O-antigen/teichoic acid export membrane protein
MMLIVLAGTIPRYFVEGYLGEHALGIFGAIGYLGLAGIMAVGALGESATARLAEYYASRRTTAFCMLLLKLCAFAVAIGCAGVVVAVVAGGPILSVLYGPEYAAHADILVWIMIAAGISYVVWFVNHSVTAVRYFRSQLPLHLLAAAITGGACWWLVPHYGLTGAAVALSVTGVAQLVGAGLVISHALWKQATTAFP